MAPYLLLSASVPIAMWWGVVRNKPDPRLPWVLLTATQVMTFATDVFYYVAPYEIDLGFLSLPPDVLYLARYPLLIVGFALLIRRRTPGRDLPSLVDAAALAVVATLIIWVYVVEQLVAKDLPVTVMAVSVAFPVADLAVVTVAFRLLLGVGRRTLSVYLLMLSPVVLLFADSVYSLLRLGGTYQIGSYLDAIWLLGGVCMATAALHPSMKSVAHRAPDTAHRVRPAAILMLLGLGLLVPGLRLIEHLRGDTVNVVATAAASAALVGLIIARLTWYALSQHRMAITDELTGLRSRRYLEAQLPIEVARAEQANSSVALFLLDLDHFKSINDRHGHPAGDRVLVEVARRLRQTTRPSDVLARYGGEEFAVLAPGADLNELRSIAHRMRRRVASSPIEVADDTMIDVTVSIGVASYPSHATDASTLVEAADRALYAAKSDGRDWVVIGATQDQPAVDSDTIAGQRVLVDFLHDVADEVDALLAAEEHSSAISRWMKTLAVELGMEETTLRRLEIAGRLHDVGKIMIPKGILTKSGPLNLAETQLLRRHPEQGAKLVRLIPEWESVAEIISQHHERYDGGGYPLGISGDSIRIEARMVAVCDAWAAMRANRPHQPALDEDDARQELIRFRGRQFDPKVTDVFLALQERGELGQLATVDRVSFPQQQTIWAKLLQHLSM
ncbi:MAG: diguanylate cyclase [Micromonosporaceae bacterium]